MESKPNSMVPDESPDIEELASRACNGTFSAEDQQRLDTLLAADQAARSFYGLYMMMHAELLWRRRGGAPEGQETAGEMIVPAAPPSAPSLPPATPAPSGQSPGAGLWRSGGLLSSAIYAVYAVPTLLLAIVLLAGWAWDATVSRRPVNRAPLAASPGGSPLTIVGKIAAMKNCLWVDARTAPTVGSPVPLGRKYALLSGLLEIKYAIGPTVTVEGPAEYEIDAPAGGFLHVGKLTLRLGVKPGDGKTNRPFFCVHIPRNGPPNAHHSFRTQEMDLVVTVDKSQNAQVLTFAPSKVWASLNSKPLKTVLLPDVPSTVVGVDERQESVVSVTRRGMPSSAVAGEKGRGKGDVGYVQGPKEVKQGERREPANRPKS